MSIYLFVFLVVNLLFILLFFSAEYIFSRSFSLNFARTLGRAVDKLLNGPRVNSHGQSYFWKAKLEFVSRQHKIQIKTAV